MGKDKGSRQNKGASSSKIPCIDCLVLARCRKKGTTLVLNECSLLINTITSHLTVNHRVEFINVLFKIDYILYTSFKNRFLAAWEIEAYLRGMS
jgi:hypothetical protein